MVKHVEPVTDFFSCASAGVFQQLYNQDEKLVQKIDIQNITTKGGTRVTIVGEKGLCGGENATNHVGQILGPGISAGSPGGSKTYQDTSGLRLPINAAKFWWTADNTGDQISVEYLMIVDE